MKIKVNKTNGQPHSVVLDLSVREFEIFTAWVGESCPHDIIELVNTNLKKKTSLQEINNFIGNDGYLSLIQVRDKDVFPVAIIKTVEFVYDKSDGSRPTWRNLDVTEEKSEYICGFDNDDAHTFKKFLKSKIVGGKILTV